MESAWSNGRAAYRCRHGCSTARPPDAGRPRNAYVREDAIVPHLPALHLLITGTAAGQRRRRTRGGAEVRPQVTAEDVTGYLREQLIVLLVQRNAGLEARVGELEERLERAVSRNSGNSGMAPSSDDLPGKKAPEPKPERPGKKKQGKQPGAPGAHLAGR
jgi:hypothetical protein